jgi:hypothetical protein
LEGIGIGGAGRQRFGLLTEALLTECFRGSLKVPTMLKNAV